jgi:radical SAM protein with 4Fe4S-binding SPASM domain
MKSNFGEAAWLLRLAKELDCESALDPVLSPGNDGNRDNLRLRLDKKELAAVVELLEKNGPRAAYRASRTAPRASRLAPLAPSHASRAPSLDFFCGAGRNVAAVDPYGDLSPCLQLPVKLGNVLQTPLMILWKSSPWLKKWRALKTGDLKECRNCANLSICNRCPGVSLLEEGDVLVPNEPACEMAELKAKG